MNKNPSPQNICDRHHILNHKKKRDTTNRIPFFLKIRASLIHSIISFISLRTDAIFCVSLFPIKSYMPFSNTPKKLKFLICSLYASRFRQLTFQIINHLYLHRINPFQICERHRDVVNQMYKIKRSLNQGISF